MSTPLTVESNRRNAPRTQQLETHRIRAKRPTSACVSRVYSRQNPLDPDTKDPFTLQLAAYMVDRLKQLDSIYGQSEQDPNTPIDRHTSIFELASSGPAFSSNKNSLKKRPDSTWSIPTASLKRSTGTNRSRAKLNGGSASALIKRRSASTHQAELRTKRKAQ